MTDRNPTKRVRREKDSSPPGETPSSGRKPLQIVMQPGETPDSMLATAMVRPTVKAAATIKTFDRSFGELDVSSLVGALCKQVEAVLRGELGRAEEMLLTQAQTLDTVFHQLARIAGNNLSNLGAADTFMRLSLRAQSQSRATLETLAVIKNPTTVAFVRQANIANGPQQVNNAVQTSPQEESAKQTIGAARNERLDGGTTQAAGSSDSKMEAVGAINGTKNARG
jgi:hypothetical protein